MSTLDIQANSSSKPVMTSHLSQASVLRILRPVALYNLHCFN